ncbi:hypothetical protein E4U41_001512 [Claviceps citrina]|nr:hypothetical protein E4U41_001512 [Claviceps citrina]
MKSFSAVILGAAVATASVLENRFANSSMTGGVVYTTEVVTALTTYCPMATTLAIGNKTYVVTSATTLTITDCPCTIHKPVATAAPVPDECAKKCNDAYDACSLAPDANHSFCASQLAKCVGYNPFPESGYVKPTSCATTPGVAPSGPGPVGPTGTESGVPPPPTVTAGAGHMTPALALLALGAVALL